MEKPRNWQEMTWQERRDVRFNVWLNPEDVEFVSPEAERLYKERVTRIIKAIKLEEPDRVPVNLPTGNYPAYWAGSNFHTLMYDYEKRHEIWIRYMEEFGDMDLFSGPAFIPSGKISEIVTSKRDKLPGIGLPKDATINQFAEDEYMKADEYDLMMMDPTDYTLRYFLPRTSDFFKSFAKLQPLRMSLGNPWVGVVAEPGIHQTLQTMLDLSEEYNKWQESSMRLNKYIKSHGYPAMFPGGPMVAAPFDHFADSLRGTRGIVMDMYRQPKKLHEAMEYWLNLQIDTIVKNFPITACPISMIALHKGDDVFMSDAQFEEFYWPTFRRLLLAMIEEGVVPMPFAEGRYTNRLKQITDTPKSGVVWWFDKTDMAEAKKTIGDNCCILGNVPTSLVIKGTVEQVKERCRKLIEDCAPGGGYILGGGASIDTGKIENLKAMMDAAKEYGVYK